MVTCAYAKAKLRVRRDMASVALSKSEAEGSEEDFTPQVSTYHTIRTCLIVDISILINAHLQVVLSHSSFRKRVKQEYTKVCQAKRAKILSDVRQEMQENRTLIQRLIREQEAWPTPPVKPLPPETFAGMEHLRNVSICFTNAAGKSTYVKVI